MASWAGGKSVSWSGLEAERRAWLRGRRKTGRIIDWPAPAKIISYGNCKRTAGASKRAKPRKRASAE